jgi:hypothetical protein
MKNEITPETMLHILTRNRQPIPAEIKIKGICILILIAINIHLVNKI